jgi:hypothetical protein
MNQEQEIRAKALEIAVGLLRILPPETLANHFTNSSAKNERAEQAVIDVSKAFEAHIRG